MFAPQRADVWATSDNTACRCGARTVVRLASHAQNLMQPVAVVLGLANHAHNATVFGVFAALRLVLESDTGMPVVVDGKSW